MKKTTEYMLDAGLVPELRAEIERLTAELQQARTNVTGAERYWEGRWRDETKENERLRDLVLVAQPEMERIEFCEASADDGYGTRLATLRQWLVNARRALEPPTH